MAERKDRMALLSRYSKLHTLHYQEKPRLNLNVEQWAADALIQSYGLPYCYDMLDHYFKASQSPSWKYFANYAHEVDAAIILEKKDKEERAARRKMAERWLND